MAKFYGPIGYVEYEETAKDVIVEKPVERLYKGDLLRNSSRFSEGKSINDTVTISNQISIVADPYALNHMHTMRYVKWRGAAWKISDIDASEYPRLKLTLGGVYNGESASES